MNISNSFCIYFCFLLFVFGSKGNCQNYSIKFLANYQEQHEFYSDSLQLYTNPLQPYTDQVLIKNNNIKSLVIFTESNQNDLRVTEAYRVHMVEMEFNNTGNLIYKRSSPNSPDDSFTYFTGRTALLVIVYDENNRLISRCIEGNYWSQKKIKTYDSEGNLSRLQYIVGKDTIYTVNFQWLGKEVIMSAIVNGKLSESLPIIQCDENGRITQLKSNLELKNINYDLKTDTLITTTTTYRMDTLYSTEIQKTLLKFNRIISYVKNDCAGKLQVEMNVTLDKNGNATYYHLNHQVSYVDFFFNIQNFYDHRNLLTKRMIYYNSEPNSSNIFVKMERYFFDSDTLSHKLSEGALSESKESEYNSCDGACDGAR